MLNITAQLEHSERHKDWIAAGQGFSAHLGFEAEIQVQGLGRLDLELIWADANAARLSAGNSIEAAIWSDVGPRITLSRLWVLGGYELVRVISESKMRLPAEVTLVKSSYERVRMPLAKLEAAKKHRSTDFSVATPIVHQSDGIGWLLASNIFLTRRSLSDSFLNLGKILKAHAQPTRRCTTGRGT